MHGVTMSKKGLAPFAIPTPASFTRYMWSHCTHPLIQSDHVLGALHAQAGWQADRGRNWQLRSSYRSHRVASVSAFLTP